MLRFATSCTLILASAMAIKLTETGTPAVGADSNADPKTSEEWLKEAHDAIKDSVGKQTYINGTDWRDTLQNIEFEGESSYLQGWFATWFDS